MLLDANVAQLVEQFTRNEQVAGSNPAISSKKGQLRLALFWSYVKFACGFDYNTTAGSYNLRHRRIIIRACEFSMYREFE